MKLYNYKYNKQYNTITITIYDYDNDNNIQSKREIRTCVTSAKSSFILRINLIPYDKHI